MDPLGGLSTTEAGYVTSSRHRLRLREPAFAPSYESIEAYGDLLGYDDAYAECEKWFTWFEELQDAVVSDDGDVEAYVASMPTGCLPVLQDMEDEWPLLVEWLTKDIPEQMTAEQQALFDRVTPEAYKGLLEQLRADASCQKEATFMVAFRLKLMRLADDPELFTQFHEDDPWYENALYEYDHKLDVKCDVAKWLRQWVFAQADLEPCSVFVCMNIEKMKFSSREAAQDAVDRAVKDVRALDRGQVCDAIVETFVAYDSRDLHKLDDTRHWTRVDGSPGVMIYHDAHKVYAELNEFLRTVFMPGNPQFVEVD